MGLGRRAGLTVAVVAAALAAAPGAASARIAFNAGDDIYTINADGSGRTRVVAGGSEAAWSPDGQSIAYVRLLSGDEEEDERSQIWVMNADGSGARAVSAGPKHGRVDASPNWSPDGQRIAFVRFRFTSRALESKLISASARGGDERTHSEIASKRLSSFASPAWSPDGSRILLTQYRLGKGSYFRPTLYRVDVATGSRSELRDDAEDATWSPDGERIAYSSVADRNGEDCGSDECSYNGEIYVMRADGSEPRRLTDNPAPDSSPDWSPDGQRIAFASGRNFPAGESNELYSIRPDGSCLTWLTNGTAQSYLPDWEPGTAHSADPGGCGATPREPLIETDTSKLGTQKDTVWWLGPRFGELLISDVDVGGRTYLDYEDCAAFEPSTCGAPLTLSMTSTCAQERIYPTLSDILPGHLTRHAGALVDRPRFEDDEGLHIFTGPTAIDLGGRDGRAIDDVLDGLRRFGDDAPPAGGLPLAQLPLRFMRALERARAAYRKYGDLRKAARQLHTSTGTVRDRLAQDRRLRQLGPFGRIDCAGRP
jgi:dipeptidyl aminopeptidase/acylaminoacyl peptidase